MLDYIVPIITAAIFGSASPTTTGLDFNASEGSRIHTQLSVDVSSQKSLYKTATPVVSLASPQSLSPVLLEVSSSQYKGVIFGISREQFQTSMSSLNLHVKAHLQKIGDIPIYVGTAIVPPSTSPSPNQARMEGVAWSFIGIPIDKTLSGPVLNSAYNLYGESLLNAVCIDKKIDGMMTFTNPIKQAQLLGVFAAPLQNSTVCSSRIYRGSAKMNLDLKVIDTHIGPLLSGEGFITARGVRGVDIYTLAVAKQLVSRANKADMILKDNVHVIDPEAYSELIGFTQEGYAVFNSLKGNLVGLVLDDVIVGKATPRFPNGFLKKVVDMRSINGKVVLKLAQGTLDDLLQNADIDFEQTYDVNDVREGYEWFDKPFDSALLTPPLPRASRLRGSSNDFIDIKVNKVIFDYDDDHATKDDQVLVTGNITFTPKVKIKFRCEGTFCGSPYFLASFGASESSHIKLKGTYKKSLHETFNLPPSLYLPPITAGPLVFVPKFSVQLHVNGSLSVSVIYEAEQEFTVEAGLELEDGNFAPFDTLTNSFTDYDPIYSGEIGAEAELAVKGSFMLYGLAGAYADLGGYISFDAGIPRDPTWEIGGGFRAGVGVDVDLLIWSTQYGIDLFDRSWEIKHAPNMPPIVTVDYPKPRFKKQDSDDFIIALGSIITIGFSASDPEGATSPLFVDITSNLDGVIASHQNASLEDANITYTFLNEGNHTITVSSTDGAGLTGITTRVVEVKSVRTDLPVGTVENLIPSSAIRGENSYFRLQIELDPNVVVDHVEWYQYEAKNEYVTLANGSRVTIETLYPEFLGSTTGGFNVAGTLLTHELVHIFPASGLVATVDSFGHEDGDAKRIQARIIYTRIGLPQNEIIEQEITLRDRDLTVPVTFTGLESSDRTPAVDELVRFSPYISSTDSKCVQLSYTSSNSNDGVNGFMITSNTGQFDFTFLSSGVRTITANVSRSDLCEPKSQSVDIDVTVKPTQGGLSGFEAQTGSSPFSF